MTGTLVYHISDWAEFVTGVVIPVDGDSKPTAGYKRDTLMFFNVNNFITL